MSSRSNLVSESPYSLGPIDGIQAEGVGVYRRCFIDIIDDLNGHDDDYCENCRGNNDAWRYEASPNLTVDWDAWDQTGDVYLIDKRKI